MPTTTYSPREVFLKFMEKTASQEKMDRFCEKIGVDEAFLKELADEVVESAETYLQPLMEDGSNKFANIVALSCLIIGAGLEDVILYLETEGPTQS